MSSEVSDTNGDTQTSEPALSARLPAIRLANRSVVNIDLLAADEVDEKVAVAGEIVQRVALLDGWLYEVEDGTGRLWVRTDSSQPEVGQRVTVEGVVRYEAIVVDGIDAGGVYLEEQSFYPSRPGDG